MCDCYHENCKICGKTFFIHLIDYKTGRDEIALYCELHMPEDVKDGVVWQVDDIDHFEKAPIKERIFIQALTENAKEHWAGNMYNGECEPVLVFGSKEVTTA